LVDQSIIDKRLSQWTQPKPNYTKGVLAKFAKLAKSASEGAVTD
jgi:dihydroxy-acid dehydratase